MPALTYNQLSDSIGHVLRPSIDLQTTLNLVLPRIYGMGYWRDLVYQTTITTDHTYFALPRDSESLMAANVDEIPQGVQSRWTDFSTVGSSTTDLGPDPIRGVVDDGLSPCIIDLDSTAEYLLAVTPNDEDTVLPSTGVITIKVLNSDGTTDTVTFTLDGTAEMVSANITISEVVEIIFDAVPSEVNIIARKQVVPAVDDITIARGVGSYVSRYRRYRLANPSSLTKTVFLLLKRKFIPITGVNDVIYIGNLNAVKHGLLGTVAEDNADLQRAEYHWGVCRQLLEEEMDAHRGAARPTVKFDPYGGAGGSVPNIM